MTCVSETDGSMQSCDRMTFDNLLLSKIFCLTHFSNANRIALADSMISLELKFTSLVGVSHF